MKIFNEKQRKKIEFYTKKTKKKTKKTPKKPKKETPTTLLIQKKMQSSLTQSATGYGYILSAGIFRWSYFAFFFSQ